VVSELHFLLSYFALFSQDLSNVLSLWVGSPLCLFYFGIWLLPYSNKKSVKLLVDCLFSFLGSGKPFSLNKHETVHARRREPSQLILRGNLPDF
jgi:hypothetical protein